MRKQDELNNPQSCLNRALPVEMIFVLLARDECAADAIRHWCRLRVIMGKNGNGDPEILEALECANAMDDQFRLLREELERAKNKTSKVTSIR